MRHERWPWLPIFCVVSLIMHLAVVFLTRGLGIGNGSPVPEAPSIEVTFEPAVKPPEPERISPPEKQRRSVVKIPRVAVPTPIHVTTIREPISRPIVRVTHAKPNLAVLPKNIAAETPTTTRSARTSQVHRNNNPKLVANTTPVPNSPTHTAPKAPETPKEVAYSSRSMANLTEPANASGGGASVTHDRSANPLGAVIPNDQPEASVRNNQASNANVRRSNRSVQLAEVGIRPSAPTPASRNSVDMPSSNVAYAGRGSAGRAVFNSSRAAGANASVLHDTSANLLGDGLPNDRPEAGGRTTSASASAAKIRRKRELQLAEAGVRPYGSSSGASLRRVDMPGSNVAYAGSGSGDPAASNSSRETGGIASSSVLHVQGSNPLGDGIPDDRPGGGTPGSRAAASTIHLGGGGGSPRLAGGGPAGSNGRGRSGVGSPDAPNGNLGYAGAGGGGNVQLASAGPSGGTGRGSLLSGRGSNPLGEGIPDDRPGAGLLASRAPVGNVRLGNGSNPKVGDGGGSFASNSRGHSGLRSAEAPRGNIGYSGDGGGGGTQLASAGPSTSGAGRGPLLRGRGSNPLGDGVPEDKPGAGPGSGGGDGGPGLGNGIGNLRAGGGPRLAGGINRPGLRGSGSGGGRVRGPDRPGAGIGDTGFASAAGKGGDGSAPNGPPIKKSLPHSGNVAGIIRAAIGPPGRGNLFELRPTNGSDDPVHIVYAMDTSGSMRDGFKILKAKEALKKALGELRPEDTFNIIAFTRETELFESDAVSATPDNIRRAKDYVDAIKIGAGTNISGALDLALRMSGISFIYVMSDGEPNGGIEDFGKLRKFIHEKNTRNIRITTLALGLGEKFPGMRLLKAIADENGGTYDYINMTKIKKPAGEVQ